jgi:hypothetical protein
MDFEVYEFSHSNILNLKLNNISLDLQNTDHTVKYIVKKINMMFIKLLVYVIPTTKMIV